VVHERAVVRLLVTFVDAALPVTAEDVTVARAKSAAISEWPSIAGPRMSLSGFSLSGKYFRV
jgi:hypothetical protein